ncbi:MAG: TAXI family TRAP transporter solute-binding subunit [Alphaproteobacteria bacterium]|nr:TAXI family TRAP transporter solute-binding subunit [Alphaproteobacteria bacterium]MCB9930752.1 TAXI family TRAP transporter solute-binding subunit [Alphaproteobacteria bacterium]
MILRTLSALALAGVTSAALAAEPQLPKTMVWTAYDLGSSGYAEATGMANAFKKKFGTRIRIIPAGTSIGRLLPLVTGKASFGFLANEAYFAAEGSYDFADEQWGPQDIRIVLGKPTSNAIAVAGDAGIKTVYDLKGKRLGYVKGNPSVNVKQDAYLAFAGLTRADVDVVWFGSYSALKTAVLANQIDGFSSVTTSANMREIEASPRGLWYAEVPADDKEGWKKLTDVIDFAKPMVETQGAGLSKEHPANILQLRYPMVTVYPKDVSADDAYNFIKAADMAFDDYKNTTATGEFWAVDKAGPPPYDAPAHEGTIRYLKEKGIWTDEHQAWQDARLARLNKYLELWGDAQGEFLSWREAEAAKGNKVNAKDAWPEYWEKYRADHK